MVLHDELSRKRGEVFCGETVRIEAIITAKEMHEGCPLPPWYYGFAYREWFADRDIWLPIPLNVFARCHRWLMMRWDAWRGREDSTTSRIWRMAHARDSRIRAAAYDRGFLRGLELSRWIK